ncbi:MAG: AraC family transcriptional regulator [Eubacteriales bacterium]|jgi:AraC family transcriptional regulator|nr:AraC family transcriptional regulator [Eubacteriales bacterium]
MNWIESISEAINYIEENLEDELKIEDIADKAFISTFYFQKAFSLLCGFSVGEYIRSRRLANAGNDLLTTEAKIIDIAMKYRYDSPDSFTKAFTRFHGSTPTAVRKNGQTIKSFAPLKLNLLLKGGYIMDYRIEKREAFSVVVKADPASQSITYIDDDSLSGFSLFSLGAYFARELPEYSLFRLEKNKKEIPDGFEKRKIPAITWGVFKCAGTTRNDAREKTWQQICSEWLPQTNYEIIPANYIYIFYSTTVDEEDSYNGLGEIWVAIKEK